MLISKFRFREKIPAPIYLKVKVEDKDIQGRNSQLGGRAAGTRELSSQSVWVYAQWSVLSVTAAHFT